GVAERNFGGLAGFFRWLDRHKYKVEVRVFMSRWRSPRACPTCGGRRVNEEALGWRVGGKNLAELSQLTIDQAAVFLGELSLSEHQKQVTRSILPQITARFSFLLQVGLGYLTLDRTLKTLSAGEAQRVTLTSTLASSLVNVL